MLPATGDRRENDKAPVLAAETVAVASSEALVTWRNQWVANILE